MCSAGDAIQFGSRGHGSVHRKPDANVWVDGEVANYFRETYEEVKERLGETRALRLAGHNTMFPTLSWLNGTATLRVWHPRGPNKTEVWAFCICDADAPQDVKDAFERSATRAGPVGFLEQDDSENWVEIQKVLRGYKARQNKLIVEMGKGSEKVREDGVPVSPAVFFL